MTHAKQRYRPGASSALLSVNETRRRLGGIARSTLYRMFERGELRPVKLNWRTMVAESELQDYIDDRVLDSYENG